VLLAITQPLVPFSELVQAASETFFIGDKLPGVPLGGTVLANDGAGPSLGGPEALLAAVHRSPATLRA
jgi:hypothetical protein